MPTATANPYLSGLMEQRAQLAATLQRMIDMPAETGNDLTTEQVAEARTIQNNIGALDERMQVFAEAQRSNDQHESLVQGFSRSREQREQREQQRSQRDDSLGGRFVGSAEFREYRGRGTSSIYNDEDSRDMETRAPTLTANLQIPHSRVTVSEPGELFPLFGLVGRETVSTGAFEYVRSTLTNNAAVVAEGQPKPESPYVETLVPGTLDTIAHWTQLSRQALEDSARVRSIVDGKLTTGVLRKVHDSIAAVIEAAVLTAAVNADLLSAIRVAAGMVQENGWNPNAVLLNPADWAALDIGLQTGVVQGQPVVQTQFWGMRPIASSLVPAGTAYVGDYLEGVTLFSRNGVGVYVSDSHASTFVSNIFTILAEMRAKAVVVNASAIVKTSATLVAAEPAAAPTGK